MEIMVLLVFAGIAIVAACTILVIVQVVKKKKKKASDHKPVQAEINVLSDNDTIDPFIEQIDAVLANYLSQPCVQEIRASLINELITAQKDTPKRFERFAQSADYQKWALAHICNRTFDILVSGRYHTGDMLTPEGQLLAGLYRTCMNHALNHQYIDEEAWKKQIAKFHQQLLEAGKAES